MRGALYSARAVQASNVERRRESLLRAANALTQARIAPCAACLRSRRALAHYSARPRRMPRRDRDHVAPTLVDAVRALADDDARAASCSSAPTGPSGSARSTTSAAEAERRGGAPRRARAAQGRPPRDGACPTATSSSSRSWARSSPGVVPVPIYPQLSLQEHRELPRHRRAHRARLGRRDAPHDRGDAAVRRAGRCRARRDAARDRRPSTSSRATPGTLDVARRPGRPRVPPVHERQHLAPQGRHGHARQPRRERRGVHDPRPAIATPASTRA